MRAAPVGGFNNNNNNEPPPVPNGVNQSRYNPIPEAPRLNFLRDRILEDYVTAREKAQNAKNKDVVAFIGMTGVSKSTCVNSIMGLPLGENAGRIVALETGGPKIGHTLDAESTFAETFNVLGEEFKAIDTGGFCDTFGTLRDYSNALSMYLTLQTARSVKFVMCCTVADITDFRAGPFKKTTVLLHENILHGGLELRDSVILLATQPDRYRPVVSLEEDISQNIVSNCQRFPQLESFFNRINREGGPFIKIYEPRNREHREALIQMINKLPPIVDKTAIRVGYPDAGEILDDFVRIARYENALLEEFFDNKTEAERVRQRITELENRMTRLGQDRERIRTPTNSEAPEGLNQRHEAQLAELSLEIRGLQENLQTTRAERSTSVQNLQDLHSRDDERRELKKITYNFNGIKRTRCLPNRSCKCTFEEEIGDIGSNIDTKLWLLNGGRGTRLCDIYFRSGSVKQLRKAGVNSATFVLYSKRNYEKGSHNLAKRECATALNTCTNRENSLTQQIAERERDRTTLQLNIDQGRNNVIYRNQSEALLEHLQADIEATRQSKNAAEAELASLIRRNEELKRAIDANQANASIISEHLKLCNDLVSENTEIILFRGLKEQFNQNRDN